MSLSKIQSSSIGYSRLSTWSLRDPRHFSSVRVIERGETEITSMAEDVVSRFIREEFLKYFEKFHPLIRLKSTLDPETPSYKNKWLSMAKYPFVTSCSYLTLFDVVNVIGTSRSARSIIMHAGPAFVRQILVNFKLHFDRETICNWRLVKKCMDTSKAYMREVCQVGDGGGFYNANRRYISLDALQLRMHKLIKEDLHAIRLLYIDQSLPPHLQFCLDASVGNMEGVRAFLPMSTADDCAWALRDTLANKWEDGSIKHQKVAGMLMEIVTMQKKIAGQEHIDQIFCLAIGQECCAELLAQFVTTYRPAQIVVEREVLRAIIKNVSTAFLLPLLKVISFSEGMRAEAIFEYFKKFRLFTGYVKKGSADAYLEITCELVKAGLSEKNLVEIVKSILIEHNRGLYHIEDEELIAFLKLLPLHTIKWDNRPIIINLAQSSILKEFLNDTCGKKDSEKPSSEPSQKGSSSVGARLAAPPIAASTTAAPTSWHGFADAAMPSQFDFSLTSDPFA